jgi:hypothetical protein
MRDSVAVESPRIAAVPMSRAAEPATFGRRAVLLGAAGALVHRRARAEAPNVPIRLQAELLGKVAGYDRNFEARSGEQARILIVVAPGNSDSKLTATDMRSALGSIPTVGGLSHDEEIVSYVDAPSLAETCRPAFRARFPPFATR